MMPEYQSSTTVTYVRGLSFPAGVESNKPEAKYQEYVYSGEPHDSILCWTVPVTVCGLRSFKICSR
eukprot:scaffold22642_cov134-Cylindrotheca_fusiformis.AAC.16